MKKKQIDFVCVAPSHCFGTSLDYIQSGNIACRFNQGKEKGIHGVTCLFPPLSEFR